jgi:hypothetical protein
MEERTMAQLAATEAAAPNQPGHVLRAPDRPIKILAKSLFRELRANGWDERQIVALSTELIGLLTTEMKDDQR